MRAVAPAVGALLAALALVSAGSASARQAAHAPDARVAHLLRSVTARASPSRGAARLAIVRTATPEGESNIVRVLAERRDRSFETWARIELAILPNRSSGWVPRSALGEIRTLRTRLVVDRTRHTATLLRDGRIVFRTRVGVGLPQYPTPRGEFTVRQRLTRFEDALYGPIAFGTSARSPVLTDWPGGGFIGIHGTDRPELIPGRVSHGCIRMRNADIRALARLLPLGTPLTVR
jgi:lipoprotein-anchoring transpeptidase ErfK/SrfK